MVRKGDRQAVRQRDKRNDRETERVFRQRDNVPTGNRQEVRGIHGQTERQKMRQRDIPLGFQDRQADWRTEG